MGPERGRRAALTPHLQSYWSGSLLFWHYTVIPILYYHSKMHSWDPHLSILCLLKPRLLYFTPFSIIPRLGRWCRTLCSMTLSVAYALPQCLSQISHATNRKADILDNRLQSLQLDNEHKDRQALLDWLTSSNYPAQQATLARTRQEGTGSWFIESEEFKTWSENDDKTLICQGIPGAGQYLLQERRDASTHRGIQYSLFARQNYACITGDRPSKNGTTGSEF